MILRAKSKISSRKTISRVNLRKQTVKIVKAIYMSWCPVGSLDYIYIYIYIHTHTHMPCYISSDESGIKSTVREMGRLPYDKLDG